MQRLEELYKDTKESMEYLHEVSGNHYNYILTNNDPSNIQQWLMLKDSVTALRKAADVFEIIANRAIIQVEYDKTK